MNIEAYCERIAYRGPTEPTLRVLRELTRLQPHAIAFENVSVAAGAVPDLELQAIEAKLLQARRGGYCFELNATC